MRTKRCMGEKQSWSECIGFGGSGESAALKHGEQHLSLTEYLRFHENSSPPFTTAELKSRAEEWRCH